MGVPGWRRAPREPGRPGGSIREWTNRAGGRSTASHFRRGRSPRVVVTSSIVDSDLDQIADHAQRVPHRIHLTARSIVPVNADLGDAVAELAGEIQKLDVEAGH